MIPMLGFVPLTFLEGGKLPAATGKVAPDDGIMIFSGKFGVNAIRRVLGYQEVQES